MATPVCMAPANDMHGSIQAEAAFLLTSHLRRHRPDCRVIVNPGVIPRVASGINHRVPDLGVTCGPPSRDRFIADPVLLLEILSSSNEAMTRSNVWTYSTIPSVTDILLLATEAMRGELLTRSPGGEWPASPVLLGGGDHIPLANIGLILPLAEFYRTTDLGGAVS